MTTTSRRRRSEIAAPLAYLAIWILTLIVFWCFTDGADAMGFSILYLWIILPLSTVIASLSIGLCDSFGRWKWLGLPIFGVMYMLAEYGTFALANIESPASRPSCTRCRVTSIQVDNPASPKSNL